MKYNGLIGLSSKDKEFVARMLNEYGRLGISKIQAPMTRLGYSYSCFVKVATREEADALRLQDIFGGNIQKTVGKQHIWQLPQKYIIALLEEISGELNELLKRQTDIIIKLRRLSFTAARTTGRSGIPPIIWRRLDKYYLEMSMTKVTQDNQGDSQNS